MLRMSSSLSAATMPLMMALARLPDLNSCSCLTRYSGCCWASLGLTGVVELPSAAWQEAHTAPKEASPLARSGLAEAAGAAAKAEPASRAAAVIRVEAIDFMGLYPLGLFRELAQNPGILQCCQRQFPDGPPEPPP